MQSERHPSSKDYANVLVYLQLARLSSTSSLLLSATLSFLSFCNIRDRLAENSDNSRGSKPITKVAKLDFQVVAFGHLFSIARLMLRNATTGCLVDLFNTCKATLRPDPFPILHFLGPVLFFLLLRFHSAIFQLVLNLQIRFGVYFNLNYSKNSPFRLNISILRDSILSSPPFTLSRVSIVNAEHEERLKGSKDRRRSRLNLTLGPARFLFFLLIAILRLRSLSRGLSSLVVSPSTVGVTRCQAYIFPSLI